MFKELKDFLFQGNIVALAVAVVIAVAFGAVIASLVADIITPLLSALGLPDFSTWTIIIGANGVLKPGVFLNTLINFVFVAGTIFFFVVKPMQAIEARKKQEAAAAPGPTEIELLIQIRDELAKRP
ncbi:MAG: large conductance mechanosensitive channel protein MscL [Chloroflexi bacterium]|nr:large conductance mechanosensitive channel protein MscL [Chloroflexota bacterium]